MCEALLIPERIRLMLKFLEGLRAGFRFRRQALIQFKAIARGDWRSLLEVRGFVLDYLWTAAICGHLPAGFMHEVFMQLEDASSFTPEKFAAGQDWFLLSWCDKVLERLARRSEASGYLPGFVTQARAHFDGCERCRRRMTETVKETARTIQLVRSALPAEGVLDEAASQRFVEGIMARIQKMEAGPDLRCVTDRDGGDDDA